MKCLCIFVHHAVCDSSSSVSGYEETGVAVPFDGQCYMSFYFVSSTSMQKSEDNLQVSVLTFLLVCDSLCAAVYASPTALKLLESLSHPHLSSFCRDGGIIIANPACPTWVLRI